MLQVKEGQDESSPYVTFRTPECAEVEMSDEVFSPTPSGYGTCSREIQRSQKLLFLCGMHISVAVAPRDVCNRPDGRLPVLRSPTASAQ